MLGILLERLRQKKRTVGFPASSPALPERFRGRPFIDAGRCVCCSGKVCTLCLQDCPTGAITGTPEGLCLDMGVCSFCGNCAVSCPHGAIAFTNDWRLASTERDALIIKPAIYTPPGTEETLIGQSYPEFGKRPFVLPELPVKQCDAAGGAFSRSFRLRQVTAAGCGACEADLNVLCTVVFDISRFGMDFVASPRHADGLVLTGPVPRNMREALLKCHMAMPAPKPVIAVGACAISGGIFRNTEEAKTGRHNIGGGTHLPVDLYIPGCPPHPYTSLDGLLRFIGRETFFPSISPES